ncbi:MAG: carbonic anhydrase [Actinomycetota bacterium]
MGAREELIEANGAFAAGFDKGDLEISPAKPVVVLTCIDARIDPAKALGLEIGDAHVIRNAGGRATDDAIRSLLISSWLLGTREYLVIHHTDCGMTKFTDDVLIGMIKENTGEDVSGREFLSFSDVDVSVQEDVETLRGVVKALPEGVSVSGHVYDVQTGSIREVVPAS